MAERVSSLASPPTPDMPGPPCVPGLRAKAAPLVLLVKRVVSPPQGTLLLALSKAAFTLLPALEEISKDVSVSCSAGTPSGLSVPRLWDLGRLSPFFHL